MGKVKNLTIGEKEVNGVFVHSCTCRYIYILTYIPPPPFKLSWSVVDRDGQQTVENVESEAQGKVQDEDRETWVTRLQESWSGEWDHQGEMQLNTGCARTSEIAGARLFPLKLSSPPALSWQYPQVWVPVLAHEAQGSWSHPQLSPSMPDPPEQLSRLHIKEVAQWREGLMGGVLSPLGREWESTGLWLPLTVTWNRQGNRS